MGKTETMTQLTEDIWAVEVPIGATRVSIPNWNEVLELTFEHPVNDTDAKGSIQLPAGEWCYMFCTDGCTEDEAGIMGFFEIEGEIVYRDYCAEWLSFPFSDPIDSLRSLLVSCDLDPNNNYALLKKIA